MKASELRIGNLVKINNALLPETHGKTYSVYKLQKTFDFDFPSSAGIVSLTDKVNRYIQFDQFIEPIPLTEEWLERFGFEKLPFCCDDSNTEYGITIDDEVFYLIRYKMGSEFYLGYLYDSVLVEEFSMNPILYVHQLQNLFFAITGEELTLKEKA